MAACQPGGGDTTGSSGAGTTTGTTTGATSTSTGTTTSPTTGASDSTSPGTTTTTTATTGTTTLDPTTDPATGTTTGPGVCNWGDGSCTPGTLFFCEQFDDAEFAARGWYDGSAGMIDPDAHSGAGAFACHFKPGGIACADGKPARHPVPESGSVWLSYWVRYSDNWVGSGKPYHPHEFHFTTNEDDVYVGPSSTHLTTYIEAVDGVPRLAIQDAQNVDTNCILRNNDTFVGCNGDFATYVFTEMRSAAACNGILGALEGRDCFDVGGGEWYSARFWDSPVKAFGDAAPYDKTAWHRVEVYFQLNTIENGIGLVDGQVKYWFDGELLIDHDDVLLRTGVHDSMAFDQFMMLPYIGDGSPVDQTLWVDDLRVASAPTEAGCP